MLAALAVVAGNSVIGARCSLDTAEERTLGRSTIVRAADGSRLGVVPAGRRRQPIPLQRMGRWLPQATVAIEDRRFWQHDGLDFRSIARATFANLKAGRLVEGGSTLTQQLARDLYLARRTPSLDRKLEEACLAIQLERAWTKTWILELYLNRVFFGRHAYGAWAGADTYFGRPPDRLPLAQAALLAGLPQAPSRYDPFRHPDRARERRNEVLAAMREAGSITAAEYRTAARAPLRLRPGRRYTTVRAPAFFRHVIHELNRVHGRLLARLGGLQVATTLSPRLQRYAERAIAHRLRGRAGPAAALVAIDPATGAIRAMAVKAPRGRRLQFNLATQGRRQAGSAFKVFTLTAAIERGIPLRSVWSGPAALTIPARACPNAGSPWRVHNFADDGHGRLTLREATAQSVNTIFAQLVRRVGPRAVIDVAHRMGISSRLPAVCPITLGPAAVSPLEMTEAFATLAARGVHRPAHAVERVHGPVRERPVRRGRRALERAVADRVTSALAGVVRSGTGVAARIGRPAAGKTGTAEDFEDAWFCGYVPQLAACVWMGYPQAEIPLVDVEGVPRVTGGTLPAGIWHDFMAPAMRGEPVRRLRRAARAAG
jgi:penicillin-binding protein 1A